jgi:hypothetical protein
MVRLAARQCEGLLEYDLIIIESLLSTLSSNQKHYPNLVKYKPGNAKPTSLTEHNVVTNVCLY